MNNKRSIFHPNLLLTLTLLTVLFWATGPPADAQKKGVDTPFTAKADIVLSHTAALDQCRNGPLTAPEGCAGNNWANGDLNGSQAHYIEGESVPYRIVFGNLTPGLHTVTIEWDTTENSLHALDYLTTFNRTETTANPCYGIATCDPAMFHQYAIPLDPLIAFEGVTQVPGMFTIYGGTITGLSAYTTNGTLDTTSQTRIAITFAASRPDPVLAWGGHIATRADWGQNHSAVSISGAPYHMRIYDVDNEGGGQQDRSLQSSAVIYPSTVTIIKEVQTDQGGTSATFYFPFTATNFTPSTFQLRDMNDPTQDRLVNSNIMHFGNANAIVVTEQDVAHWTLGALTCVETSGGGASIPNSTVDLGTATATIIVEEGELITCTFRNLQLEPTAATATLTGRVASDDGSPVVGAVLMITNLSTGATKYARSNMFGKYAFDELTVPDAYTLSVRHTKYLFTIDSFTFALANDLQGVDFIVQPQ